MYVNDLKWSGQIRVYVESPDRYPLVPLNQMRYKAAANLTASDVQTLDGGSCEIMAELTEGYKLPLDRSLS